MSQVTKVFGEELAMEETYLKIEVLEIEGKTVKVSSLMPKKCGHYVVYRNKIYRITSAEGYGKDYSICLEKFSTKERLSLTGAEIKRVLVIYEPMGWMSI